MSAQHPFWAGRYNGRPTYHCDQETRMERIADAEKREDVHGLRLVLLQLVGNPLQKAVQKRAEAALRRLEKRGLV